MADHKTEIRFIDIEGRVQGSKKQIAIAVWTDSIRPLPGDLVALKFPTMAGNEVWFCECGRAEHTWRGDVQVITVRVFKSYQTQPEPEGEAW